ncbi:protein of unknown function DUF748 [Paraglaciecola sp. T6c]|uniref:DUF748 domain-containing protein n=1 Tax=Pseudoalteromonas atlantica (strain T6c / ATCC BAA-1087) TaxID=3042615 RepID=UPI00005C662F|nr:DUF748 domain-containing protein [Paraglaciecola sp. T6c]ABG42052.1 protein of unknown function DUF748 [Paraglaciecola sp. T6c]
MSFKNLASTFSKQAKWVRIATYLVIAYLLYALILGVITPLVLQSQLPSVLSEKTGRDVNIEKIRINPFLLRVRVTNIQINEQASNEPFVRVALLELDAGFWQSLLHLTPAVEHVFIEKPYAHVARTAGGDNTRFNFTGMIEALSQNGDKQPQEDEATSEIPHIRLGLFRLSNGHVMLSDKVTGTQINYPELGFELTDLDTLASITVPATKRDALLPENHYAFTLLTDEGGAVHLDGQFQLSPVDVKGKIELESIALPPLWPLSNALMAAKLTSGLLDLNLNYAVTQGDSDMHLQVNRAQLRVSDLTMSDATSQPKINIAGIHINDFELDTATQQIDINSIRIDEPWFEASLDKNGVDLVALLTPKSETSSASNAEFNTESIAEPKTKPQSEPEPEAKTAQGTEPQNESRTESQAASVSPKPAEPAWRVILQSFALNNGGVDVNESMVADDVHWRVFDINASTGVIDTRFESPIDYTLQLGVASDATKRPTSASGKFATNGKVMVAEQKLSGSVDFSQFALSQLQPYISQYLNVNMQQGDAGVSGTFAAGANSPISFTGQAGVSALVVTDGPKQEPLLKWQDMQVAGIQYDSQKRAFSLQKIAFDKPFAKLVIDKDKNTNISDLVVQQAANDGITEHAPATDDSSDTAHQSDQQTSLETAPAMAINIGEIRLLGGSAYFEDNSLRPRFASSIEALNGSIAGLSSSADNPAEVDIAGKIDGYAPVALNGAINPLLEDMFLDLNFSVSGAELTSVNPYSGTYMGHFIDRGLLSLDVKYSLQDNQLRGDNHVVIDQLTLGRKTDSDQALSLPLGLAIALLQDSDGVIDLGMEVSGDLNNPSFGFGSIILKALGNLITKAVTAPFSLLANLVGSDDELNEVAFSSGSAALNEDISEKLNTLAEALAKRPGLRVNIEGTVNEVPDAFELAEQKLQQQLLDVSGEAALPVDLSSSTLVLASPFGSALTTMFTSATNKQVDEERLTVKAQLLQDQPDAVDGQSTITQEQLDQALVIAMYNQVRSSIDIPPHALGKLADTRAKAVKTFLVNSANVDTNRLFLLNSRQHLQRDESGVTLTLEAN